MIRKMVDSIKDWWYWDISNRLKNRYDNFKFFKLSYFRHFKEFSKKTENLGADDVEKVWEIWEDTFKKIMRSAFGFNKKASDEMFHWCGNGHNWEKLWYDENTSYKEDFEHFKSDLWYISDRISMDRILRVHYMLGSALCKFKREKEI